jgi:PTS system mannose-specific IIA component
MIGLVLVTHGRLAEELRLAMEHVVGPQRAVATVCIGPDDDMEGRRQEIRESIAAVDQGDGVVVLTDILGGTPCNLAVSLADRKTIDVIAGVNLPLLVKMAKIRSSEPLAEAVDHAAAAGRKYIAAASDIPNGAARPNGGDRTAAAKAAGDGIGNDNTANDEPGGNAE